MQSFQCQNGITPGSNPIYGIVSVSFASGEKQKSGIRNMIVGIPVVILLPCRHYAHRIGILTEEIPSQKGYFICVMLLLYPKWR